MNRNHLPVAGKLRVNLTFLLRPPAPIWLMQVGTSPLLATKSTRRRLVCSVCLSFCSAGAVNQHFGLSWEPLLSLGVLNEEVPLAPPLPGVYPPPQEVGLSPAGKEVGVSFSFRGMSGHRVLAIALLQPVVIF